METMKFEIPLLDRSTKLSLWQVKMRDVLMQMDLDKALIRLYKMSSSLTKEEKERKDCKALSHIHLHLSNQILQDVLKEKTVHALRLGLEELCMSKSITSNLHLKQQMYSHRMAKGTSLEDHLRNFKEIVVDLETLEVKYEEEYLGLMLLCSLPNSFGTFGEMILFSRDILTLNEVYEALFSKEKIKQLIIRLEAHGDSLFVRGRPQEKNSSEE